MRKKRLLKVFLLCVLLLSVICIFYKIHRSNVLKNNDVLLHYEEYEPSVSYSEDKQITYYEYILEDATVICQSGPEQYIVVKDEKRGFMKQYNGNVLYSVDDLKMAQICKLLSIPYAYGKSLRSQEECEQINRLLKAGDYESISSIWNEQVITTTSGTDFVS